MQLILSTSQYTGYAEYTHYVGTRQIAERGGSEGQHAIGQF